MAGRPILGQTAEVPGPKKAFIFPNAEVAASMIKRARRALLIVGSEAGGVKTRDGDLVDWATRLSKTGRVTVAATAHLAGEFRRRGAGVHAVPLMVLGDRLRDPAWGGFDGGGAYDLVILVGLPYYLEWLVLSGLKSFARGLRTVSLDNTYHPNANWSLGYMSEEAWMGALDRLAASLEEAG